MKVLTKAYDGTVVRVDKDKLEQYQITQQKISDLLKQGKTIDEINSLLKGLNEK